MRLVDADAMYERAQADLHRGALEDWELDVIVNCLDSAPTVDAAPVVHGRWDGEGDGLADGEIVLDVWYCSECGHCIDDGTDDPCVLPNYCPNCGAKMDGGDPDGR